MASYKEEEDPFEEIVFDQARLLNTTPKLNTAIRRVSSGKCVLFAKTLGICGAFFGLGLCIAIPGPTFLLPISELQVDVSLMTNIYVARSSGYAVGSIIGGILFDRFNRLFLLFVSLLLTSVFITVIPWCRVLWLLKTCMVGLGMSMGFLDTGCNVLCLDLWGRNSAPFMQGLHFSFGLGMFVAPLLAPPFYEPFAINTTVGDIYYTPVTVQPLEHLDNFDNHKIRLKRENYFSKNYSNNTDITLEEGNFIDNFTTLSILNDSNTNFQLTSGFLSEGVHQSFSSLMTISTTQKIPKRHKPSKTDSSKLGSKNWENVKVGILPPEDLVVISSTSSSVSSKSVLSVPPQSSTNSTYSNINIDIDKLVNNTYKSRTETTPIARLGDKNESYSISFILSTLSTNETYFVTHPSVDSKSSIYLTNIGNKANTSESIVEDITTKKATNIESSSMKNIVDIFNDKEDMKNSQPISSPKFSSFSQLKENSSFPNVPPNQLTFSNYSPVEPSNSNLQLSVNTQNYTNNDAVSQAITLASNENIVSKSQTIDLITYNNIEDDKKVYFINKTKPLVWYTPAPTLSHVHHFKPITYDNDTENINTLFEIISDRIEKYGFSKIQFTYLIVGLFVFAISLLFLGFLCHNPRDPKSKQEEGHVTKKMMSSIMRLSLIGGMAMILLLSSGLEVTFGHLVMAYSVNSDIQLTQSMGSNISITFWAAFAVMRFASIFFATGLSPTLMLILNLVCCTVGTIILYIWSDHVETAVWVGTILLGAGLASMFPTGLLWIERLLHVSNKVAALLVLGVSLGELACPALIRHLMVNDPKVLMHAALVLNTLCIVIFATLWWLSSQLGEKYCAITSDGYQLANQHDEEEDMMDINLSGNAVEMQRDSFSSDQRALLNGNGHKGP